MTECMNAEMRDLLPDYVAESLTGSEQARVRSHVAECAPCRAEVALLKVARGVRPQPVHLDIDAIVATIARNRAASVEVASAPVVPEGVRDITTAPSVRKRSFAGRGWWQVAAALVVVAAGSVSVYNTRGGKSGMTGTVRTFATPTTEAIGATPVGDTAPATADTAVRVVATKPSSASSAPVGVVSVGDLSDYTDAELERMLDRLDKWDGASSSEVMPTLPIVAVNSGGVLK